MLMMTAEETVRGMALEDKIALCSGANFWKTKKFPEYGIPELFMCDGSHGLRKQETGGGDMLGVHESRPAVCYPSEVTMSCSWDEELLGEIGRMIGREALYQEVGMVLGPGANLKRNPLCGRNFEYFSEDPLLSGKLAAAYIRGMESCGISCCLKHFAANSQEKCRFNSDSVMDERTLREMYLSAFETAVREGGPSAVMCAYPKLNGVHCSDSRMLLTDILRNEWGFSGTVVTDWGAMNDRIRAFEAGCDLNMPGGSAFMEKQAFLAVKSGELDERHVEESAQRIVRLVTRSKKSVDENTEDFDTFPAHALARRAAAEGAVLLKNADRLLPLSENTEIAVIGYMAKHMRYGGSGSSHVTPYTVSQPVASFMSSVYAEGCDSKGNTDAQRLREVSGAAAGADSVLVFCGLPDSSESEGFDRSDMKLPQGQLDMIEAACEANPNTVVILFAGGAVECPFMDSAAAVLYMGLPGQAGGEAAADIIYGRTVPSGKLAETWPVRYADCPSSGYYVKEKDALYLEGIYVGYRYYDKAEVEPRFPFGFGLSYTEFDYTDLERDGDEISFTVRNAGDFDGAEIAQIYVENPQNGIHRPKKELAAFRRVFLKKGESARITVTLSDRNFSVWDGGFVPVRGEYRVLVGGSSRDLPLAASFFRDGAEPEIPEYQNGSWYEDLSGAPRLGDLEAATGRKYEPAVPRRGSYTMDNTVDEMRRHSLVMRLFAFFTRQFIKRGVSRRERKDKSNPVIRMQTASCLDSPLRSMQITGGIRDGIMQGLLEMANGHPLRGIIKMIRGDTETKKRLKTVKRHDSSKAKDHE